MDATHTSSHDKASCKTLVSFAVGDRDELLYLRYSCEDPTCDWCIVEFGPDTCTDFANIVAELLTHELYSTNNTDNQGGNNAKTKQRRPTQQVDLFPERKE